ncbi:MAG: hypothetical protein J6R33_00385 [Clostridia bacterium]|nr:hypothetical protein [Clostridia bacterium]
MKKIVAYLVTLVLVVGLIYGCASVSSSTPVSDPQSSENRSIENTPPTILLCLPRDGEDHTLLRMAFTEKAKELGYVAVISEPAPDNPMTDEQVWDIEQLQHQAQAVIVYQCDGTEEGLVKKWSDAGVAVIAAGKRLDGQTADESGTVARRIKANVSYADGALSKAVASHIIGTLSAKKAGAGFIAMFGDTDAQMEFLGFLKADMVLAQSSYTANDPIVAGLAATQMQEVKSAKAVVYAGRDAESWSDAMEQTKTSALLGICSTHPEAFDALADDEIDFLAFNDPIDLMHKAVQTADTVLDTEQGLADWNVVADTVVLTVSDPKLHSYLQYED